VATPTVLSLFEKEYDSGAVFFLWNLPDEKFRGKGRKNIFPRNNADYLFRWKFRRFGSHE
jgi:hypothetical protein